MDHKGLHKIRVKRILPEENGQLIERSDLELLDPKEKTDLVICGYKVLPFLIKHPLCEHWLSGFSSSPKGLIVKSSKELNWKQLLLNRIHQSLIEAKGYNVFWTAKNMKEVVRLSYLGIKAHTVKTKIFDDNQIYKPLTTNTPETELEKLEEAKLYALCKSNLNIVLNHNSFLKPNYTFLELSDPIEAWRRKEI